MNMDQVSIQNLDLQTAILVAKRNGGTVVGEGSGPVAGMKEAAGWRPPEVSGH